MTDTLIEEIAKAIAWKHYDECDGCEAELDGIADGFEYVARHWKDYKGYADAALATCKEHLQVPASEISGVKMYDLIRKEVEHQPGADETSERIWILVRPYILKREMGEYTRVPNSALRWLFGEEGEFVPPEGKENRPYWWRTVFRNLIEVQDGSDGSV